MGEIEEGEGAEQGQIQNHLLFASGRRSRPDANILTGGLLLGFGEKMCEDSMIVRGEPVFSKVTMYRLDQQPMPNQICHMLSVFCTSGVRVRHSISLFEIAEL